MLTSVACSCVRNGRKVSVPVAKLSLYSTVKISPGNLNLTGVRDLSRHRLSGLLAPSPRLLPRGVTARSVSLSAASHGATGPLSSVPAENEPPDRGDFGSLSGDMSSRRSYRKISPDIRDDGEEDPAGPPRRPGGRNTPYWYFLQCKKLIKENKVCPFGLFCPPPSCVSRFFLSCVKLVCPVTAAGGSGCVQQRHAAGGEAAAGGEQLHGPDRRLWPSWTTQKGLQTLQ